MFPNRGRTRDYLTSPHNGSLVRFQGYLRLPILVHQFCCAPGLDSSRRNWVAQRNRATAEQRHRILTKVISCLFGLLNRGEESGNRTEFHLHSQLSVLCFRIGATKS